MLLIVTGRDWPNSYIGPQLDWRRLFCDATAIGKLANANATPYQLAVADTAAHNSAGLNGLNGSHETLDLTDALGYGGSHIGDFAATDTVDLNRA